MNYDELLARLDEGEHHGEKVIHGIGFWGKRTAALRAVVELHKADFVTYSDGSGCECGNEYPCSTIQAIEKELR